MFRINIAVELIKESSKAISSNISSLFFPVIPFILQLIGNIFNLNRKKKCEIYLVQIFYLSFEIFES